MRLEMGLIPEMAKKLLQDAIMQEYYKLKKNGDIE